MKKTNKKIASILKKYYQDLAVIEIFKKNIMLLEQQSQNQDSTEKIKKFNEKILKIYSENLGIQTAIESLSEREKNLIKYKFQLCYPNPKIMELLLCRETALWTLENSIYTFLDQCIISCSEEMEM